MEELAAPEGGEAPQPRPGVDSPSATSHRNSPGAAVAVAATFALAAVVAVIAAVVRELALGAELIAALAVQTVEISAHEPPHRVPGHCRPDAPTGIEQAAATQDVGALD